MTAGHGSTPTSTSWVYALIYRDQDGKDLGSLAVEPDFAPAREGALFRAIRSGIVPPILAEDRVIVVPLWDDELGAPMLRAARVIVPARGKSASAGLAGAPSGSPGDDASSISEDIPAHSELFRRLAQQGSDKMIARGVLSEGQVFRFKVAAYPVGDGPSDDDSGFDIDEEGEALRLGMRDIDELAANARPAGVEADESDMRTFIPASVLDATFAHAEASGDDEVGGFLLGHLERTPGSPDIFLEVTAQVPARHTDATNASLTFTSDTWTAVQDAVALRGRGELIAGWWHLHPNFAKKTCAKCPEVRRRQCPMSKPFFSATDVHMHRTVFPRAYQTALLLSDLGDETFDVRFYGWRHGNVVSRGFEIVAE